MCSTQVICPKCGSNDIRNSGYSVHNVPRYRCCNDERDTKTFMLEYRYKACVHGVKKQVVDMAINGSGIRDTSRVSGISKTTVINTLKKKESGLVQVNPNIQTIEGAYGSYLDENTHIVGKENTQKIERKNLNFRTWIKRLARKTICFSKLERMHDIVIGLLINKIEFGANIHAI